MHSDQLGPLTPFPIPTLREEWLPAIFGPFDEVARAAAEALREDPHWARQAKALFFATLPERFSTDRYRKIQAAHLTPATVGSDGNRLKYFDTPTWAGGKFDHAVRLGLHEPTPRRLLDIGAGPGHFQMVAEYFGHETMGLDIPLTSYPRDAGTHVYNDLCEFFRVRKIDHRILASVPLPPFEERFDLVTSFMTCFSSHAKRGAPWTVDDWTFFLKDLSDNVLRDAGSLYLNLTPGVFDERSWAFLKSIGNGIIEKSRTVSIGRAAMAAL